jgi:hypothetical protein
MDARGLDFQSNGGHLACDYQFAISKRSSYAIF